MTAQNLTTADHQPPRTVLSGFTRALAAELIRARRSPSARIPLLGLIMCLLQGVGWWTVATQELATWRQLFAWQTLWATGILAPIVALLIGLTVQRERHAREGGTQWRPTPPAIIHLARVAVIGAQLLALQLLVTVPIIGFGWLKGLTGAPVATMAVLAIVLWAGSTLWAALALTLATLSNLWVAVTVGLIWQVAGVLQSESPLWPFLPWTWSVRPALPLLGIHSNGTALEPDSPVWDYSIAEPLTLSIVAGAAVLLTLILFSHRVRTSTRQRSPRLKTRDTKSRSAAVSVSAKPGLTRALGSSLRRTPIAWLVGLTLALNVIMAAGWPSPYLPGLMSLLVLPFGCCALAYLVWTHQQPAWRILALRRSPARLGLGLTGVCISILTLIVVFNAAAMTVRGAPTILFTAVAWSTGTALLALNFWLITRLGVGAAIGATLISWILGLVLGATEFSVTPAWLGSFTIWPYAADTPERATIAIPTNLAVTLVAGWLWIRSLRTAASE